MKVLGMFEIKVAKYVGLANFDWVFEVAVLTRWDERAAGLRLVILAKVRGNELKKRQ